MNTGIVEHNQITEMLSNINHDLDVLGGSEIKRLPERIFVGVFIPIFAGEESIYNATLETWVAFAGGPYKEVDVVDTRGVVLFRVPAVYERENIKTDLDRKVSIAHIATTAAQFAKIHPNQGKSYLINELDKKASMLNIPANITKNLVFWNTIFKKYGKPEIIVAKDKEETNSGGIVDPDDFEAL